VPADQARISIFDRGFLFADAIYEVSAVLGGRLVDNELHLARLERSLAEIELALPLPMERLRALQKELIARNGVDEGVVYIQVSRGAAERDFLFPKDAPPTLVMFTQTKTITNSPLARTGIAVKVVPDIRWGRRDIKSTNLLAQVLAKHAAAAEGCQEAWFVEDDVVTEGGSSSAFILTAEGVIVTRPRSHKILPGCTRAALLDLLAEQDLRLEERPFTIAEALQASEAFMTSASNFVLPVVRIDGQPVGAGTPGPQALRFRELYTEHARRTAD
jgi:D-alanine transaminase